MIEQGWVKSEGSSSNRVDIIDQLASQGAVLRRLLEHVESMGVQIGGLIPPNSEDFDKQEEEVGPFSSALLADMAKGLYKARRRRSAYLNPDLFGEPAWDLLLDLYIQKHDGKRVSITSACIAASAPSTTGLRWISILEQQKLIVRKLDNIDKRRAFIELSDAGITRVEGLLSDIAKYVGGMTSR